MVLGLGLLQNYSEGEATHLGFEEPVLALKIGISTRGHLRTLCLMFYVIFGVKFKYKIEQSDKTGKPCTGEEKPADPLHLHSAWRKWQDTPWTRGKFQKSADRACPPPTRSHFVFPKQPCHLGTKCSTYKLVGGNFQLIHSTRIGNQDRDPTAIYRNPFSLHSIGYIIPLSTLVPH